MKKLTLFLCIILFRTVAFAQFNVPVSKYLNLLNGNQYKAVYTDIQKLRASTNYAKSPTLDYFEAKCLCMNGTRDAAFEIFSKMLQSNQFTESEKDFLYKEFANCGQSTSATAAISSTTTSKPTTMFMIPSTFRGKLGDVTNCYDYNQFVDFSKMPSQESLSSRIFDKKDKSAAYKQWNLILNKKYRIDTVSDRFIIITPLNNTSGQISAAVAKLQKAADFYSSYYSLSPPEQLITVFMMPNITAMQALSKKIHGINLPSTNLGYSSLNDLSLVGISDINHVGTIYHELFHLMIRADVGDIPVWLDEGLACLYSVALWQGNTLVGSGNNWRTEVLKKARESSDYSLKYPTIKLLIHYTWDEFNGSDNNNICRASVNYAMANHFMLYLQEKKLLQKVVSAYRTRTVIDLDKPTPYLDNTAILEMAVNEPVDSLGNHFTTWMQSKYNLRLQYNQTTSSVYTFNDILNDHFSNLSQMMGQARQPDSVISFHKQIKEISDAYDKQRDNAELEKFYTAEDNRIHGTYNPYINTGQYATIKQLYDKALNLELRMRKAIFR